ncbi:MAG: AMP-binding protein [Burkholderiales bacterium]
MGAIMGVDRSGWRTRLTEEMVSRYTRDGRWSNRTVAQCAAARASATPDAVAVIEGARTWSFGRIADEAGRLAAAFQEAGLVPGDVVSFQVPNWGEALAINLATAMAGLVANPIVPIYRDAEVGFILAAARSKLFFIPQTFRSTDYVAMAGRLRPRLPSLRDVIVLRGSGRDCVEYDAFVGRGAAGSATPPSEVDPNAVKLVLYTSGTTGVPKGVLHSHNTIMAEIDSVVDYWGLQDDDVILMPSPVTHITGYLYALELSLVRGIKTILMDRWNPVVALDLVRRHRVTFSVGATPFLKELVGEAERAGGGLETMRRYMTGGAPVPPEEVLRANRVLPNGFAFRVYGSTEAPTITLGIRRRDQEALGASTDGQIVGHEVRVVDGATGLPVPEGTEGEIVTRGPELMLGYTDWQQTEAAFDADGFFHTGDLGYVTQVDHITVTGRKKDLIVRGGEKISPKEIEDVLHRHPAIREASVVAAPHERLGETVCAFVIPNAGQVVTLDLVVEHLERARIARQKFPERIEIVDDLPRTASGKVQKNLLRERLRAPAARSDPGDSR